ncbi:unnamed protein product, partial [marine sediment metagenome]
PTQAPLPDGKVTYADYFAISDAISDLYLYDANGDLAIDELDLAAWDTIEEYSALSLTLMPQDLETANITGDLGAFMREQIVDKADIERFFEVSGSTFGKTWDKQMKSFLEYDFFGDPGDPGNLGDSFQSFDIDGDGKVTAKDLGRISDAKLAVDIMKNVFVTLLNQFHDAGFTSDPADDNYIGKRMDDVEVMLMCTGAYSTDMWADLNKDDKIDSADFAIYRHLYDNSGAAQWWPFDPIINAQGTHITDIDTYLTGGLWGQIYPDSTETKALNEF